VTSVRENEEKTNIIQPPLLVFFSPSIKCEDFKKFNEIYGLFFKGEQNVRTKNVFNP